MASPDPATVLATWTSLCSTDAPALEAACLPLTRSFGTFYLDYIALSDADREPINAVSQASLATLQKRLAELQKMIATCQREVRSV